MAQMNGREPLPLESILGSAPTAYPFDLRNDAVTASDCIARRMRPSLADDEFVGMANWVAESINDLLKTDSETALGSSSSSGSHHPSR